MNESRPEPPLRIAVLGDFDGVHTRRWLEVFVRRGHDVHAISYYRPRTELPGVTLHVLSGTAAPSETPPQVPPSFGVAQDRLRRGGESPAVSGHNQTVAESFSARRSLRRLIPPSVLRILQAQRYQRAGLGRALADIQPDVFHAHYAVEHGFYGSLVEFHPYVVSAWGSDLLVESHKPFGKLIAQRALRRADLVTANDASLARRASELGVPDDCLDVVHLGIDMLFLTAGKGSVNLRANAGEPPTVISTRALEPLYNVGAIIRAFARLLQRMPSARLLVFGDGSRRSELEGMAHDLAPGGSITFVGRAAPEQVALALAGAHVYVSAPSSDSLALSTVEAMAAGCFPIVSDLPSVDGWIRHADNGLLVRPGDVVSLTEALHTALSDEALRRDAAARNRDKAAAEGLRERNMLLMERHYYRLAGHPQAGRGEGI